MPFDAAGFGERGDLPPAPRPVPPSDRLVTTIIVVLTVVLLGMPISLVSLGDMVRYMRGG